MKKLPYLLRYVLDRCKTQKMCDKAFDNYPSTIQYVPEYYKTHEMFKDVSLYLILFLINIKPEKYAT